MGELGFDFEGEGDLAVDLNLENRGDFMPSFSPKFILVLEEEVGLTGALRGWLETASDAADLGRFILTILIV